MDVSGLDQERFMKYVAIQDSGCWLWTGSKAVTGYCNFAYRGKTWLAHRAALIIFGKVKELSPTLQVSHSCRNRHCVCPAHLTEKSRCENNGSDKRAHGLSKDGDKCHFAKLSWHQVREIRTARQPSVAQREMMAAFYGVSPGAIVAILSKKSWRK